MTQNNEQRHRMKALIVDLSLGYGGSTSRVLTLLERSAPGTLGLACLQDGFVTKHALRLGVPLHIVGSNKIDPLILLNLIRVIRDYRYDLLDSQNIQSKFWASLAALLTGTTLVSTVHSWYINEHGQASIKGRIYTGLELITNPALDLYITVSKRDRQSLLAANVPEDNIELIYNAVDSEFVSAGRMTSQGLCERFHLSPNSIVCTAVGRLVPVKDHRLLLTAVQQAIMQVPQLACLLIGDGVLKTELQDQITELGLNENVKLTGFLERSDVLAILSASDIFVMTSKYEGTPITLLEAAALGLPILSTRAGGIPELVTDREHALLVEPGDVLGMTQALIKLAEDRVFALELGHNARLHVQESFNQEKQILLTWQAYQKAWNRHRNKRAFSGRE